MLIIHCVSHNSIFYWNQEIRYYWDKYTPTVETTSELEKKRWSARIRAAFRSENIKINDNSDNNVDSIENAFRVLKSLNEQLYGTEHIFKSKLARLSTLKNGLEYLVSNFGSNYSNNIELGAIFIDSCHFDRKFIDSYNIISNELNNIANIIINELNIKYKSKTEWINIVKNYELSDMTNYEITNKFILLINEINNIFFNICKFQPSEHHSSQFDIKYSLLSHVLGMFLYT